MSSLLVSVITMDKVLAIIMAGGGERLQPLTMGRSKAAVLYSELGISSMRLVLDYSLVDFLMPAELAVQDIEGAIQEYRAPRRA